MVIMQILVVECFVDGKSTANRIQIMQINEDSNIVLNLPFVCEILSYRLLGSTRSPSPILIRVDLCLLRYV